MKKAIGVLATVILLAGAVYLPHSASAQGYGAIGFAPIAPAVANCPAGVTNGAMLCAVGTSASTYTLYVSYNAGAYQLLVTP